MERSTKKLGRVSFNAQVRLSLDDEPVVIYRGDDGKLWVRPIAEFEDGRFERVE